MERDQQAGATQTPLPRLGAPPNRHLPPRNPVSAPLAQMPALGDESLMDRTGQHRDAVPADLVAEVLTGDADGTRTGRTQDIHIQVVPFLRGQQRAGSRHHRQASTPVLLAFSGGVKARWRHSRHQSSAPKGPQSPEPAGADRVVPLPGNGVRHHCSCPDSLPEGTGRGSRATGTGG